MCLYITFWHLFSKDYKLSYTLRFLGLFFLIIPMCFTIGATRALLGVHAYN